jgi:hypothetical protein
MCLRRSNAAFGVTSDRDTDICDRCVDIRDRHADICRFIGGFAHADD